jgi:hypothetical protein
MQVFDNVFTSILSLMLTGTFPIFTLLFKKHDFSKANFFSYLSRGRKQSATETQLLSTVAVHKASAPPD